MEHSEFIFLLTSDDSCQAHINVEKSPQRVIQSYCVMIVLFTPCTVCVNTPQKKKKKRGITSPLSRSAPEWKLFPHFPLLSVPKIPQNCRLL